jgi:hypothetical protein
VHLEYTFGVMFKYSEDLTSGNPLATEVPDELSFMALTKENDELGFGCCMTLGAHFVDIKLQFFLAKGLFFGSYCHVMCRQEALKVVLSCFFVWTLSGM